MANDLRNYSPELRSGVDITTTGTVTAGAISTTGTLASGAQTITGANAATGVVTGVSGTAVTAGGVKAFGLGSGTVGIAWGSGVPTLSAGQGSLYLRTDGSSTSTRLYVNSDGGTTWVAVTTAS